MTIPELEEHLSGLQIQIVPRTWADYFQFDERYHIEGYYLVRIEQGEKLTVGMATVSTKLANFGEIQRIVVTTPEMKAAVEMEFRRRYEIPEIFQEDIGEKGEK